MATLLAMAAGLSACDNGDPVEGEAVPVDANAYAAALGDHLPPPDDEADTPPIVFVAALGETGLSLDDQVHVIDALAETHDIRFVDTKDAAVDSDLPDAPTRDDAILIGLGPMRTEPPHTVRVEVYLDANDVTGHLVTVELDRHDDWIVTHTEDVEPEVLLGGS